MNDETPVEPGPEAAVAAADESTRTHRQTDGAAPPLRVDGRRPAVELVAALPRSYKLTPAERLVLLALACDSFDGVETAPGMDALARWAGLLRSSVYDIVDRLCRATPDRPALLERESTRGGRRTVMRLQVKPSIETGRYPSDDAGLLITREPSGDTGPEPSGEPSGRPSGDTGPHPFPLPSRVTPHKHEPNAREALERIRRERRIPLSVDELLSFAYELGKGDPWDGYRWVRDLTEASWEGTGNPEAVVRSRLRKAVAA